MTSNITNYSNIREMKVTDFSRLSFNTINLQKLAKAGDFLLLNKETGLYEKVTENVSISYSDIQSGNLKYASNNTNLVSFDTANYVINNDTTKVNTINLRNINYEIGTVSETQTEIKGNYYSNKITGNDMDNIIYADRGNDVVNAGKGNDTIYGGSGDDIMNGEEGNDIMYGSTGNDTYILDSIDDVIVEKANEGNDTIKANFSYVLGENFENLILGDSEAGLIGTGNSYNNIIYSGNGADELYGNGGNDILYSGDGNDKIYGGEGNDKIYGGSGEDTLYGNSGNDIYFIEAGDIVIELENEGIDRIETNSSIDLSANIEDLALLGTIGLIANGNELDNKIIGTSGNDQINGQNGNDKIYGEKGDDMLFGSAGNDVLSGGEGKDTLDGGEGNDILSGGNGIDSLIGGTGDDTYYIETVIDTIIENIGEGTDTVISDISYTLGDNIENLTIKSNSLFNKQISSTGNGLDNTIIGGLNSDISKGLDGNDIIYTNSGNDVLYGGKGNDVLSGGLGKDIFVFDTEIGTDVDTIKDFNVRDDSFYLENGIFSKLTTTGVLNSSMFKANLDGVATDANDYLVYETDTGKLFYDADGNGAEVAIQIATLENKVTLTYQDFLVI